MTKDLERAIGKERRELKSRAKRLKAVERPQHEDTGIDLMRDVERERTALQRSQKASQVSHG